MGRKTRPSVREIANLIPHKAGDPPAAPRKGGIVIKEACNLFLGNRGVCDLAAVQAVIDDPNPHPAKLIAARQVMAAAKDGDLEAFKALIDYTDRKPDQHSTEEITSTAPIVFNFTGRRAQQKTE